MECGTRDCTTSEHVRNSIHHRAPSLEPHPRHLHPTADYMKRHGPSAMGLPPPTCAMPVLRSISAIQLYSPTYYSRAQLEQALHLARLTCLEFSHVYCKILSV